MDDLIEALQIFRKYRNPEFPTHCEHDTLMMMYDPDEISGKDLNRLEELGFFVTEDMGEKFIISFRFGSA